MADEDVSPASIGHAKLTEFCLNNGVFPLKLDDTEREISNTPKLSARSPGTLKSQASFANSQAQSRANSIKSGTTTFTRNSTIAERRELYQAVHTILIDSRIVQPMDINVGDPETASPGIELSEWQRPLPRKVRSLILSRRNKLKQPKAKPAATPEQQSSFDACALWPTTSIEGGLRSIAEDGPTVYGRAMTGCSGPPTSIPSSPAVPKFPDFTIGYSAIHQQMPTMTRREVSTLWRHIPIQTALQALWDSLPKTSTGQISKATFCSFQSRLKQWAEPLPYPDLMNISEALEKSWAMVSRGRKTLNKPTLMKFLMSTALQQCQDADPRQVTQFLSGFLEVVTNARPVQDLPPPNLKYAVGRLRPGNTKLSFRRHTSPARCMSPLQSCPTISGNESQVDIPEMQSKADSHAREPETHAATVQNTFNLSLKKVWHHLGSASSVQDSHPAVVPQETESTQGSGPLGNKPTVLPVRLLLPESRVRKYKPKCQIGNRGIPEIPQMAVLALMMCILFLVLHRSVALQAPTQTPVSLMNGSSGEIQSDFDQPQDIEDESSSPMLPLTPLTLWDEQHNSAIVKSMTVDAATSTIPLQTCDRATSPSMPRRGSPWDVVVDRTPALYTPPLPHAGSKVPFRHLPVGAPVAFHSSPLVPAPLQHCGGLSMSKVIMKPRPVTQNANVASKPASPPGSHLKCSAKKRKSSNQPPSLNEIPDFVDILQRNVSTARESSSISEKLMPPPRSYLCIGAYASCKVAYRKHRSPPSSPVAFPFDHQMGPNVVNI